MINTVRILIINYENWDLCKAFVIASMLRIEQGTKQSHLFSPLFSSSLGLSDALNRCGCFVPCSMRNMLAMTNALHKAHNH